MNWESSAHIGQLIDGQFSAFGFVVKVDFKDVHATVDAVERDLDCGYALRIVVVGDLFHQLSRCGGDSYGYGAVVWRGYQYVGHVCGWIGIEVDYGELVG